LPILTHEQLKTIVPPAKSDARMRIALSHEFVELYRGDKDLRVGKILAKKYNCEIVHLGTDIASPADSRVFKTAKYPVDNVGPLPDDYYLLLLKTRLIYHRRRNISLGGFFRWTPSIIRQMLRWKPDLVFENPYLTLTPRSYMTFIAANLLKIPKVYIDCGDVISDLKLKNKIVLPLEMQVVRRAAAVITYNMAGKTRFENNYGYPSDKIHVIPKPVDTERFSPKVDGRLFKSKYDLNGKFVAAYFGRLCENKGARYLLDAARIIRQRGAEGEIVFLFVGGNVEAEHAARFQSHLQNTSLKNVRLTGMLPNIDMPSAYAAADIAVFPDVTNLPGFSTVLAESMAAGLPIIIGIKGWESAVPIQDGYNGLIIEPANPAQIADSMERLKNNSQLRETLSRNVLRFAREQMDYKIITRRYFEIFREITGKNRGQITDIQYDRAEDRYKELIVE